MSVRIEAKNLRGSQVFSTMVVFLNRVDESRSDCTDIHTANKTVKCSRSAETCRYCKKEKMKARKKEEKFASREFAASASVKNLIEFIPSHGQQRKRTDRKGNKRLPLSYIFSIRLLLWLLRYFFLSSRECLFLYTPRFRRGQRKIFQARRKSRMKMNSRI